MNKKIIQIKSDEKTQEQFFELKDFADFIDISQVHYYELGEVSFPDGKKGLSLKFFDKDKNLIKTN